MAELTDDAFLLFPLFACGPVILVVKDFAQRVKALRKILAAAYLLRESAPQFFVDRMVAFEIAYALAPAVGIDHIHLQHIQRCATLQLPGLLEQPVQELPLLADTCT
jgi:hypothetical protein